MNFDSIPLVNHESLNHFELTVKGQLAFIDYKLKDNKIYLIHTEVPETLRGTGSAEAIVSKALHFIEDHQLKLVPLCSYVQVYLKRHPEWNRLLA
ncbi:GNAT family N-acetyltransferase [Mucilaginibacter sp. CSA2-8R]|uniref:GNAT family N-acetyltransferase n=1 Tax=Mucilaginibacter sp. CSA2-8R TaxID=3141542 RepID=UPI00315CAB4D